MSGSDGKDSAYSARDTGSIPVLGVLGRSPGEGNNNPLWYLCLENPWTGEPGHLQSWGHKELDTTERLTVSLSFTTKIEAVVVKIYNNVYTIDKYVKVIEL